MAESFTFDLVSPERLLVSGDAKSVLVPGSEGDFVVLPGHAPVLATLRPGLLDLVTGEGEEKRFFVRGGFAEAGPTSLTVLAQQAIDLDALDPAWLAEQIQNAREDVADAKDAETRHRAETTLEQLEAIQRTLAMA